MILSQHHARALESCLAGDGVAVFPTDTVYGLACAHDSKVGLARLLELKGRGGVAGAASGAPGAPAPPGRPGAPASKPLAVMVFTLARALELVPWIGPRTRAALDDLLPGPLTVVLEDPQERFGAPTVGLRVPALPMQLSALQRVDRALLQSSANPTGEPDARRCEDVAVAIRSGADLVLDGGELPGVPSTVLDLSRYEPDASWSVLREGAVARGELAARL